MEPAPVPPAGNLPVPGRPRRSIVGQLLLHAGFIIVAVVAFAAYEHLRLHGRSAPALGCLIAAAAVILAPARAAVRELLAIEGKALHLLHGVGGLVLLGLGLCGVVSGGPLLTHAALAPFAIMGAAQAIMHQEHPRNPEQSAALRRFASSLPEVRQLTGSSDLASPANVRRAVAVLTDLVAKAQALGETELRADPGFQGALRQITARFGLTLGLDAVDQAIGRLSANPAAASALPELRRRLSSARQTVEGR